VSFYRWLSGVIYGRGGAFAHEEFGLVVEEALGSESSLHDSHLAYGIYCRLGREGDVVGNGTVIRSKAKALRGLKSALRWQEYFGGSGGIGRSRAGQESRRTRHAKT
jgi:hypothetical protein